MSLRRLTIRQRIRDLLVDKTSAADRVYLSRVRPYFKDQELPAIAVYGESEAIRTYSESPRVYRRDLRLAIEIVCEELPADPQGANVPTPADVLVDGIAEEVELAMMAEHYLGLEDCDLSAVTYDSVEVELDDSGDRLLAACRMVWVLSYDTEAQECDPADLAPFATAHFDWDIPFGESVDAEDDVALPTS